MKKIVLTGAAGNLGDELRGMLYVKDLLRLWELGDRSC